MRASRAALATGVAALALAGTTPPSWAGPAGTAGAERRAGTTRVVVEVWAEPGARVQRWTLRCAPPRGTHPQARAACTTLSRAEPRVFRPVSPDTVCTMIYGGPQRARVTGLVAGRAVRATFTRSNGCELYRWDALAPLLPRVSGSAS